MSAFDILQVLVWWVWLSFGVALIVGHYLHDPSDSD